MKNETPSAIITAEQLAGLTGLTKRRLYQLADEKKIPPADNGGFPMLETIRQLFAYFQRDGEQLSREKLRLATAARKLSEMKAEEAEALQNRTWMLADDARQMMRMAMNSIEQLPGNVRSQAGLTDLQTATLQKNIDDYRNQLAADIEGMKPK